MLGSPSSPLLSSALLLCSALLCSSLLLCSSALLSAPLLSYALRSSPRLQRRPRSSTAALRGPQSCRGPQWCTQWSGHWAASTQARNQWWRGRNEPRDGATRGSRPTVQLGPRNEEKKKEGSKGAAGRANRLDPIPFHVESYTVCYVF